MLRSLFISAYLTFSAIVLGISLYSIAFQEADIRHVLIACASAVVVFFFASIFIVKKPRTSAYLIYHTIVLAGISLVALFLIPDLISTWPIMLVFVGWFVYLFGYSIYRNRDIAILRPGQNLPELNIPTIDGSSISNADLIGRFNLLLFYRGNWCPFCVAQLEELTSFYKQLERMGTQIFLISPQSPSKSSKLARRFDLNWVFLHDNDNELAKKWGIVDRNGLPLGFQVLGYDSDVPKPTVVITDANLKIIYSDLTSNYRLRPEPGEFLRVITEYIPKPK